MVPKKRGPVPWGHGKQIQVRLQPDLLSMLDAYSRDRGFLEATGEPKRPDAIRSLMELALVLQKVTVRDAETIRALKEEETTIRSSGSFQNDPDGGRAAIRRLWLTGSPDTGGASYAGASDAELKCKHDEEQNREFLFNLVWQANSALARTIDWRRPIS
jgi:hypothetical protein